MHERISDAEWEVMEVLWADAPLSATQIAERIPGERNWTLTTVKTLLSRLLAKSAIGHEAEGRRFLYSPKVSRSTYVSGESRKLVDRLFGGRVSPLVAHLAEQQKFSPQEIAEIERLLEGLKS